MKDFTLRKRFLDCKSGTSSLFKGFVMLVVLMLMTTSSAMAQEPKFEVIDGFRYLLDSDTKTATLLSKGEGKYSGDIIMPEKVKDNDGVEYVVTSLSESCFEDCSGLTSITIPSSVTSLGERCFNDCRGLTSITIPSSVTSLGEDCFQGCSGLTSITIPSSVTSLGRSCFNDCSSLTSITIPSSVTSLGELCFYGCSSLTSITIPSSVTSLGEDCFWACYNLDYVIFKGKYCDDFYYSKLKIPTTSRIKVPTEYLQGYKHAFGSDYKYISAWNPDETGEDNKPLTQCSTPSVSYKDNKLIFACETSEAQYHYTINDTNIKNNVLSENGEVSLSAVYKISVYTTADGWRTSDKAEATLSWNNANLDNGININPVRTRGVMLSVHDGIITLSGLDNGEVVKFYAANGKYLGSSAAVNGTGSYAVNESLVIAKVGKDSINIRTK